MEITSVVHAYIAPGALVLIGLESKRVERKNKNDYTELNGPGNATKISKREKTRPKRLQTAIVRW